MTPGYRFVPSPPSFPLLERQEEARARPQYPSSSSRDQRVGKDDGGPLLAKPEASNAVRVRGLSDGHFLASPTSSLTIRAASGDGDGWCGDHYGMGWMPSKMRFKHKTKTNNCQNHCTESNTIESDVIRSAISTNIGGGGNYTTRVCSDCNTTTTPLWRSGPRGPKSLCNACGIRQRKARRAMEEAAAAAGGLDPSSSSVMARINGSKVHNKEKKSHGALGPTCKKTNKASGGSDGLFGDFSALRGTFPRDVTDAAILLMDLSRGLTHT